jgi:hypothetical protein
MIAVRRPLHVRACPDAFLYSYHDPNYSIGLISCSRLVFSQVVMNSVIIPASSHPSRKGRPCDQEAEICQFAYVLDDCDPIDLTGAAAPMQESVNVCGKRRNTSSSILQ